MIISVCGTPGTGKTAVSKLLAKRLGYDYIDLNKFVINAGMLLGRDVRRNSLIVDIEKLKNMDFKDNSVVDGHLSHFIPADLTIILRTEPNELKKRLEPRGWGKSKIDENFEAEVMGICSAEAREVKDVVVDFDTSRKKEEEVVDVLAGMIKSRKFRQEPIDWKMENYL